MKVYTVHLKGSPDDLAALERAVFVREGFSWSALVFGPLWLLWNRLWLALVVVLALETGLALWSVFGAPARSITIALQCLLHVALALESAQLLRGSLARRRFQIMGLTHGARLSDAERAYFAQLRPAHQSAPAEPLPLAGRGRAPDMVGLFPSAGV